MYVVANQTVQQEVTIQALKSTLLEMRKEFADDMYKVIEWSKANIKALSEENRQLRSNLVQTQTGLTNLAFNVQGVECPVGVEASLGTRPALLHDIALHMTSENSIHISGKFSSLFH